MERWQRPAWWELGVQAMALLAIPTVQIVLSILEGFSPPITVLIVVGTVALLIFATAQYESWRAPFRHRVLQGKQLIDSVDVWLRENQYTRGPAVLEGYTHAIVASGRMTNVWIGIPGNRPSALHFITARFDSDRTLEALEPEDRTKLKYDIALEIARMGAFYEPQENPFAVTIWDVLPVDEKLNEGKVISRVLFIERVDHLIQTLYGKYVAVALVTSTPTINPPSQATPGTAGSSPR